MCLASLTFPKDGLLRCVNDNRWEQCEDILPALREFAMKSSAIELERKAEYAELVAVFLCGVYDRHRPGEVAQTAEALVKSKAWHGTLFRHPHLFQSPGRPGAWRPVSIPAESCAARVSPTQKHAMKASLVENPRIGCDAGHNGRAHRTGKSDKAKMRLGCWVLGCGHKDAECVSSPVFRRQMGAVRGMLQGAI